MSLANMSVQGPFRSKNGLIFGVIRGLADYYGISPYMLRLAALGVSIFLAFWPVLLLYIAAAIIMPAEPTVRPVTERDRERVILGRVDPATLVDSLVSRADNLERKIRRLEDHVTSKSFRPS
ncbi:MAG: PspC domain-containing protein [Deltaproteobacteria bacterium]|jgi:phage shock protein C|nr:PspC domain-containing protein [Deltaproteobacteria bacterium]